jgi:hypothetical protein
MIPTSQDLGKDSTHSITLNELTPDELTPDELIWDGLQEKLNGFRDKEPRVPPAHKSW